MPWVGSVSWGFLFLLMVLGCSGKERYPISAAGFETHAILIQGSRGRIGEVMRKYGVEPSFEVVDADDDIYLIRYAGKEKPSELSNKISGEAGIGFSEPNYEIHAHDISPPKDPRWMYQWALMNVGQDSPHGLQGRPGADIRILKAWEKTRGDEDVVVGVLDTGIDYTHPDLRDNMWVNQAELKGREKGIEGVDDDGNGWADDVYGWNFISDERIKPTHGKLGHPDPRDDNGHGTHCAGIIGAKPNNIEGISGLNWNVKLMALKFLDSDGSGHMDDASRAVLYAIKNKVHILSMSWGSSARSKALEHVFKKAEQAGILLVAAAGNSQGNNDEEDHYPSNYELGNLVSVAATDNRDRLAQFSSYGIKTVHLAAPGVDIMSTIPEDGDPTTHDYYAWSGTSMATPMVSGAAALFLAAYPQFRYKPSVIKTALLASVTRTQELMAKVASGGRLNVAALLDYSSDNPASVEEDLEVVTELIQDIHSPTYPGWYPQVYVDHVWTITRKGAQKIRLFFEEFRIDTPYDLLAIYTKGYFHVLTYLVPVAEQLWSPWVEGDTIRLRFANSIVKVVRAVPREFKDWEEAQEAGAYNCKPKPNSEAVMCMELKEEGPVPNAESEGFRVAQVQYLKKKGEK